MPASSHVYQWREIVVLRGSKELDPQKVGELIEAIPDRDKADALWRAARRGDHYLHGCFEWNTTKAAQAHWRSTAERIIRSIYIQSEPDDTPRQAFVSINDGAGRAYHHLPEIQTNLSFQLETMRLALRDLNAFRTRYRMFREVCEVVREAEDRLEERMAAASRRRELGAA